MEHFHLMYMYENLKQKTAHKYALVFALLYNLNVYQHLLHTIYWYTTLTIYLAAE